MAASAAPTMPSPSKSPSDGPDALWPQYWATIAARRNWGLGIADYETADSVEGWHYGHIDPDLYHKNLGDLVAEGELIGYIVDFWYDSHHTHFGRIKNSGAVWQSYFDYVFIDSPPLWAVVDALVVGSVSDSVVLVVQPEKTAQKPFLKAVGELRQGKARILGVLFNQVKGSRKDYLYYMDYYRRYGPHYHSGGGGEVSEPRR